MCRQVASSVSLWVWVCMHAVCGVVTHIIFFLLYTVCSILSLVGTATSTIFVTTKHVYCRDKSMLVATKLLLRQTHVCCDKTCYDKHVCCWKHTFVMTKDVFCRNRHIFVMTNVFVTTKHLLRQKLYLRQLPHTFTQAAL